MKAKIKLKISYSNTMQIYLLFHKLKLLVNGEFNNLIIILTKLTILRTGTKAAFVVKCLPENIVSIFGYLIVIKPWSNRKYFRLTIKTQWIKVV